MRIHITGVYGLIGNLVYTHLSQQPQRYDLYGSGRRRVSSQRADEQSITRLPDDHFAIADLSDAEAIASAIDGMDAVLHIGAVPDPSSSFDDVLSSNVRGTYNVLEACRLAGVKRLVYASSIMVNWGYFQFQEPYRAIREQRFADVPASIPMITHMDLPRPTEPYSASKVWAEALCRTYFDAHALSTICLRIGWVNKENHCFRPEVNSVWCGNRDIVDIFERALEATEERLFDICYALSESKYRWVDREHTYQRLGFMPQDKTDDVV
ncbi:MAG: NAD(P)-dependent oxidoreductase [Caldilineaceae bacterium]|nr:NAD(P)-dependent oxidoreductase [Caldilineaceae bacterium]